MEDDINTLDLNGNRIGSIGKLEAHQKGVLHEAFSIFIFNKNGELLLQRRNLEKYHSGGLWTNTCCSHPSVGEDLSVAVHRRLQEEMGFDTDLKEIFSFKYLADNVGNNLTENELDHVFVGFVDGVVVNPDPKEVAEYKWITMEELEQDISNYPEKYTAWLKIIMASGKLKNIS